MKKFFLKIFCWPIYLYKFLISPLLPNACRFYPSCSTYFLQAVQIHGIFRGSFIGAKRILRCNPKNKNCGFDPVPMNIKGESKWLL